MKSLAFDAWDGGRLTVNREFAPLLRKNGLTNFDSLMNFAGGRVAKNLLRERTTTRLELVDDGALPRVFFLKRHRRPPIWELVKPWLRLTRPIVGARNEWEAILRFHQAGIPTMTPVALGESSAQSFLLTAAIEGCCKLSEWAAGQSAAPADGGLLARRQVVAGVAEVARTMHAAGLHHQDFYLTHLMVSLDAISAVPVTAANRPLAPHGPRIQVLDLGRARWRRRLSRRWIVKDLAQLDYSAPHFAVSDRMRFLAAYLGRPIETADRPLIEHILRKSRAIARHSRKNGL